MSQKTNVSSCWGHGKPDIPSYVFKFWNQYKAIECQCGHPIAWEERSTKRIICKEHVQKTLGEIAQGLHDGTDMSASDGSQEINTKDTDFETAIASTCSRGISPAPMSTPTASQTPATPANTIYPAPETASAVSPAPTATSANFSDPIPARTISPEMTARTISPAQVGPASTISLSPITENTISPPVVLTSHAISPTPVASHAISSVPVTLKANPLARRISRAFSPALIAAQTTSPIPPTLTVRPLSAGARPFSPAPMAAAGASNASIPDRVDSSTANNNRNNFLEHIEVSVPSFRPSQNKLIQPANKTPQSFRKVVDDDDENISGAQSFHNLMINLAPKPQIPLESQSTKEQRNDRQSAEKHFQTANRTSESSREVYDDVNISENPQSFHNLMLNLASKPQIPIEPQSTQEQRNDKEIAKETLQDFLTKWTLTESSPPRSLSFKPVGMLPRTSSFKPAPRSSLSKGPRPGGSFQ